jgi:hypothetical protein
MMDRYKKARLRKKKLQKKEENCINSKFHNKFCSPKYCYGDQNMKNEMGGACNMHKRNNKCVQASTGGTWRK